MTFIPERGDQLHPEHRERLEREAYLRQLDERREDRLDDYTPAPEASFDTKHRIAMQYALLGLVNDVNDVLKFLGDVDTPVAETVKAKLEGALERPVEVLDRARLLIGERREEAA